MENVTVLTPIRYRGMSASAELVDSLESAASRLERLGATRRSVDLDGFRYALDMWSALMQSASQTPFDALLTQGGRLALGREYLRLLSGRSAHTLPAVALVGLERIGKRMRKYNAKMRARFQAFHEEIYALFGPDTVLLYPPYTSVAPRHNRALMPPTKWRFTAVFNILELPVTQVPMGLNAAGMPLGVQVVAGHGLDHVSIAIAQVLEEEFGGWVPPEIKGK